MADTEAVVAEEAVDAGLVDSLASVADDHDHAEGRGQPIARTNLAGDTGAGAGLVQPGAIVLVRTLAEMVAWGAGWTQELSLAGLLPVGVGTSFLQAFAEATSYGISWGHVHTDDHAHNDEHVHAGPNHQHDGTHGHGQSLTWGGGNVAASGSFALAAPGGGGGSFNASTEPHLHAIPSGQSVGGSVNNASFSTGFAGTGSTGNKSSGGATSAKSASGSAADTASTSWLPPMRGMIYARKV